MRSGLGAAEKPRIWALLTLLAASTACHPGSGSGRPPGPPQGPRAGGHGRTGAARAFVVVDPRDLLAGPGATGRLGDVRLDNGIVAFVIEALDRRWGFALGGGNLVDAGVSRGGRDALAHLFTYFGDFPRQAVYERLSLRTEPNGTAVVRVEGRDSRQRTLAVSTEYALAPGADYLKLTTSIENGGADAATLSLGDAIQWGGLRAFAPGHGFGLPPDPDVPWLAGLGTDLCIGYGALRESIRGPSGSGWTDTVLSDVTLAPGERTAYTRVLVVSGSPDITRVAARVHALRGDEMGTLEGSVTDPQSRALPGARVEIAGVDGSLRSIATSGSNGAYVAELPVGDYTVRGTAEGRHGGASVRVAIGATTTVRRDLSMTAPGLLRYRLKELGAGRTDDLVSGKLTIEGIGDTDTPDLGPRFRVRARNVVYTASGHGNLPLAPGRYRVTASRGPEYALTVQEVTVPEGGEAEIVAELARVVDSHGVSCGDFHQHTTGSSDASTTILDRVISNVGEGVEIAVASDHNVVTSYDDAIARLGLARELFAIQGNELTTDTSPQPLGHFNAYPVPMDRAAPDGGAWDVFALGAADLFARARADGVDRVIQVNHPRAPRNGFFALSGYDPRTNRGRPGVWASDFDTIEVFSSNRVDKVEAVLADVYSMWNRGLTPVLTGSSDSHGIVGEEPGFPRTCLALSDDPSRLTVEAVVDVLKRTRNGFVTNGPFVRFSVDGVDVGGLVRARGGRVTAEIEVQAAPWIDVHTIEIVVNGERRPPITVAPVAASAVRPVLRHRGSITLRLRRDSWVQLVVRGEGTLAPVVQHDPADPPLALTNAIWVDVDGNGRFNPPIAPEGDDASAESTGVR